MTVDREALAEVIQHRDTLLQIVQEFLQTLTEEDVAACTPEQRDQLKDMALYSGCTHLTWWNPQIEVKK